MKIVLRFSKLLAAELYAQLEAMSEADAGDPAREAGIAACAAFSGGKSGGMLRTDDPAVARTVLGELNWIADTWDGGDSQAAMASIKGAAKRRSAELRLLIAVAEGAS